jgi:TatD DNase family protein
MLEFIDTHIHLHTKEFDEDRSEVIARAKSVGVTRFISIGAGDGTADAARAVTLAETFPEVWASVGVHPHDAACKPDWSEIERFAPHPKVVAIGETGLDYHYDFAPKETQFEVFERQIEMAIKFKKPLIIHCREAAADCLSLLKNGSAQKVGGVFHCFSETASYAAELRDIHFLISLPGIITFKNAANIQNAVREIPLEQIMLETDGPFLAPIPYRGKRCESAFLIHTAEVLAKIKGLPIDEIARVSTLNAERLFGLHKDYKAA